MFPTSNDTCSVQVGHYLLQNVDNLATKSPSFVPLLEKCFVGSASNSGKARLSDTVECHLVLVVSVFKSMKPLVVIREILEVEVNDLVMLSIYSNSQLCQLT